MENKLVSIFSAVSAILLLAACGGGGESTTTPTPIATAVTVTCPNNTSKTATTLDLATALCAAPAMLTIAPTNSATAVSVDSFSSIDVTTDSSLDVSSLTAENITLKTGAINVAGTVSAVGTNSFKFSTSGKLNYAQSYTFNATVKDALGRVLVVNSIFTTASVSCISPQISNNTGNACVAPPLLSTVPILLPDLQPIYTTMCGADGQGRVILHKPTILDLNKDGRKDMVVTLWCLKKIFGLVDTEPVVNRVIAFLQQADGSFIDGTKELFGTNTVSVSGASMSAVAYDFNGDGYDDIAFAASTEDGRLMIDNSGGVQSSYMMSDSNGKYRIGKFGTYQWGYSVHLMDNQLGKKDVVATPIGYGTGTDAWQYNRIWSQLQEDYRWFTPNGVMFKRRGAMENSRIALAQSPNRNEVSFSLFTRDAINSWGERSRISFGAITWIPITLWNTQTSNIPLMTFDGQDYIMPYIDQGCEMKIRPNEESVAIMQFGAYKLPTAVYDGKPLVEGKNMVWESKLVGVSVANGTLTRLSLTIENEINKFTGFLMSCGDVNGDGFDDIVVEQRAAGNINVSPFIYINNKNGGFALVDPVNLPSASAINNYTSSMFIDLDGDGIGDLMYWPTSGVNTNTKPVQFQIFKGLRNINFSDFK